MQPNSSKDSNRTLYIKSVPWESFKENALEAAQRVDSDVESDKHVVNFEDPMAVYQLLTPNWIMLMRELIEEPPQNVENIANRLNRGVTDVRKDIAVLEKYNVASTDEDSAHVVFPYNAIEVEIEYPHIELVDQIVNSYHTEEDTGVFSLRTLHTRLKSSNRETDGA